MCQRTQPWQPSLHKLYTRGLTYSPTLKSGPEKTPFRLFPQFSSLPSLENPLGQARHSRHICTLHPALLPAGDPVLGHSRVSGIGA